MDELQRAQEQLGRALDRARAGEDRALAVLVREYGEQLVHLLNGLLRMSRLHSVDNHAFDQPIRDLRGALSRLVDLLGAVHLVAVEDQVYLNDIRIRLSERGEGGGDLGPDLRRQGVGGISFHAVPSEAQLRQMVACFAVKHEGPAPRAALQAALSARGLESIELFGIFRFRVSGEQAIATERSAGEVTARATGLMDEAWDNLGASRLPNPLPLRRVVTEILELGAGAEGLWDEPDGASPHSAHSLRVCRLALILGRAAGLSEGVLQDLGVAAMFHDVGYAAREGAEPAQGAEPAKAGYAPPFERHATAGARLLLRQRGFHEAKVRRVLAVLEHHRDYADPRGRPSLFGRILRIVEDYDNLTRARGAGLTPPEALARMIGGAGSRYDPVLLRIFVNTLGRWPPGTLLLLEDGRVCSVVATVRSLETFATPLVRIETLGDGTTPAEPELVDLAQGGQVRCVLKGRKKG